MFCVCFDFQKFYVILFDQKIAQLYNLPFGLSFVTVVMIIMFLRCCSKISVLPRWYPGNTAQLTMRMHMVYTFENCMKTAWNITFGVSRVTFIYWATRKKCLTMHQSDGIFHAVFMQFLKVHNLPCALSGVLCYLVTGTSICCICSLLVNNVVLSYKSRLSFVWEL